MKRKSVNKTALHAAALALMACLPLQQMKAATAGDKTTAASQQVDKVRTFHGVVTDANGEPIIGATVSLKGTGAITDIDGNFNIKAREGEKLTISYIGYLTQTVAATDNMQIVMQADSKELTEVVVVGYGVERKANVVGSISTVSADKLKNRSTPSLSNALTGMMPGVTVRQTTGRPGADGGEIRVRGVGSFGSDASALILIDGIPGSLNDIHMDDVENISVLKDASTAAIYGSRAANGVILVTTKTGSEGKAKINYNGYVGVASATELPNKVDTWEYARLYNIASGSEHFTAEQIQKFKDGSDPDNYANNDLLGGIIKSGVQTGHDLSISGGNAANKYMLSMGYLYQEGIMKKNDYSRYNVRFNLVNQLMPKLTLTSRIQGVYSDRNQPNVVYGKDTAGMQAIIANAVRWPGVMPDKLQNGNWSSGEEGYGTALMWINSKSFSAYNKHSLTINEQLDYSPIKELKLSVIGAYTYTGDESKDFRSTFSTDTRTTSANELTNNTSKDIYKTFQATANFVKDFGKHNVNALVGYSWEQDDYRYVNAKRVNLPSDDYPEIDTGDSGSAGNGGGGNGWALQSLFGRAKYNYDERYLADFTFRYDGSSRFPADNRYAFFPSVAAGWRISQESFMASTRNVIDNLKVKASWGKLGNQNIGNYPYQSVYVAGYNYPFGSNLQQGVTVTTKVDPTLHWETTTTADFGIEGSLWNRKLTFDITYFNRRTTDILFSPSASVSGVLGFGLSKMNMGELENKGFEFQLGHFNKIGEFEYHAVANFSIINNKVITLGLADVEQPNGLIGNGSLFIGHPMEIYYGYKTDGVFLEGDDIAAWNQGAIAANSKVGDIRYCDTNGDGVVNADDRVVLGSRIPKYTFGLNLGASYKGIDFSAQLQGVAGVKGYLEQYAGIAFWNQGSIQKWQAEGCFDPENPTRYPAYPRLEIVPNNGTNNTNKTSDFWMRNASYLRVKSVQLGYSLPASITKVLGINNLRCYVQAENPITFHSFPEGWDPEINTNGNYYPILKTFTFGLNVNF